MREEVLVKQILAQVIHPSEVFNNEIELYNIALVKEAVRHFNTKKFVPTKEEPFDERYFFNKEEIDVFLKMNKNPRVHYRECTDDLGNFFCYEIYREKLSKKPKEQNT